MSGASEKASGIIKYTAALVVHYMCSEVENNRVCFKRTIEIKPDVSEVKKRSVPTSSKSNVMRNVPTP